MEMYNTNTSSFGTSLTLQSSNSFRDVSFSSYLNKAEENMIRKLTNDHNCRKKAEEEDEEELGVFGAEKYFKGEIQDVEDKIDHRFDGSYDLRTNLHQRNGKVEDFQEFDHSFPVKLRIDRTNMHTPSVRSNASGNSRTRLLPLTKPAPQMLEKGSKTKQFLASFGCNCINKKSTQINEKRLIKSKEMSKPHTKMLEYGHKTDLLSNKSTPRSIDRKTRNDYFSFPVLNSNDLNSNSDRSNSISNSKYGNLAGKVVGVNNNNGGGLTLGRKLSLLNNWEIDIPTEEEVYIPAIGMYKNEDVDSDSSSDLFEIESFSTTGNNSFIAPRKSDPNCYAPSEVSVDWSVVTASAADFSVFSDYEEVRTGGGGGWRISGRNDEVTDRKDEQKKRPGILSGCTSHKAVRVAGDECNISDGGAGGRRRLSESMAVGSRFRGGMI
ncbi:hypothetical protein QVD17_29381 [Tagetes erecta]|uniref:Protein PHYTOCHROME KINASE SUBSTRATE 1-like n=1 Tax=Tagetes erecta TaxID=13708 RepID=A0AAD8KF37_TARER|nr:hypothetical protein QVD17_29381 [Tagetes erecta]